MTHVIAQLSDVHIGGHPAGCGERLSLAVAELNAMTRRPDLVLFTGDLTQESTSEEWDEFASRLEPLDMPWEAIAGNHDRRLEHLRGHRAIDSGPLRLVLVDSADDVFGDDDADWLHNELAGGDRPAMIAIHHPPFETGIWWMDCVGLKGIDRFQEVVAQHPQVIKVVSGHIHRTIQTNVGTCSYFVCPSTAGTVAIDLDPEHAPAETAEPPMLALHAWTGSTIVSHVVAVGAAGERAVIDSAKFVAWAREQQAGRETAFA